MKMRKRKQDKPKTNGDDAIKFIYSDEYSPSAYLDCALRRFNGEQAEHPQADAPEKYTRNELPTVASLEPPEAGIIRFEGDKGFILYCLWTPSRNRGNEIWRPIARFHKKTVAGSTFMEARRPLNVTTTAEIAALEAAHGRTFEYGVPKRPAERETIHEAYIVAAPGGGMWRAVITYHGLLFSLCKPQSQHLTLAPVPEDPLLAQRRARNGLEGSPV